MNGPKFTTREPSEDELQRIEQNFIHHAPHGDQTERYSFLRNIVKHVALTFCKLCPPSRELSLALTKLEEAVFWANAAIARNEREK